MPVSADVQPQDPLTFLVSCDLPSFLPSSLTNSTSLLHFPSVSSAYYLGSDLCPLAFAPPYPVVT